MTVARGAHLTFAALALACTACTGGEPADLVPPRGTLEPAWTIVGSTEASACARSGAESARIVVLHYQSGVQADEVAPCADFQMSIVLKPATYTVNATLLDGEGGAVSETLEIPEVEIEDDVRSRRSFDFAASQLHRYRTP